MSKKVLKRIMEDLNLDCKSKNYSGLFVGLMDLKDGSSLNCLIRKNGKKRDEDIFNDIDLEFQKVLDCLLSSHNKSRHIDINFEFLRDSIVIKIRDVLEYEYVFRTEGDKWVCLSHPVLGSGCHIKKFGIKCEQCG
jgi:hypothetical protein